MGVYVFNKFKNYTIISNLVLTDENLSLEEKGLFCYLFSKPDGWEFHYNAMKKELQEKSDKTIRKILNRLVEAGYITKCQVNSTNGHFGGISIKFTDKSFVQQNSKNTDCPILPFGENTDCPNLPNGKNGESVKMPSNNTYNNNNTNLINTTNISNNINNNINTKELNNKYNINNNTENNYFVDDNINTYQINIKDTDKQTFESFKEKLEEKGTEKPANDINMPKTENNAKKSQTSELNEEIGNIKQPKPKRKFQKPSLAEIKAYIKAENLAKVDANAFYDHFESNGWLVSGKAPMKDWQAAVRNWNRRADKFGDSQKNNKNRNIFLEEYKRLEEEERNNNQTDIFK